MPLHALSDLSNVDSTASPTISGLTVTNNLSTNGQIYAPNQVLSLSSSIVTQYTADKRYGNMFVNILSADVIIPTIDTINWFQPGIALTLNTGTYTVDLLTVYTSISSNSVGTFSLCLSSTSNLDIMGSVVKPNSFVTTVGVLPSSTRVSLSSTTTPLSTNVISGTTAYKYTFALKIYNNSTTIYLNILQTVQGSGQLYALRRGSYMIAKPTL